MEGKNTFFDIRWENNIYGKGKQLNVAPFDQIVSFLFSSIPPERRNEKTHICEVGCGAANNLIFCAELGLTTHGIDGSKSAISVAKERCAEKNLTIDLRVGDFTDLPYDDQSMDFVIDRAAITHNRATGILKTFSEVARILKPGGLFFSCVFADDDPEFLNAAEMDDGACVTFEKGYYKDISQTFFFSIKDALEFYGKYFTIVSFQKDISTDVLNSNKTQTSSFTIISKIE